MVRYLLSTTVYVLFTFFTSAQVQDHEGNTYKTTQIGSQTWMAENLRVKTFRNGDKILHAKTKEEWVKAGENKTPAWCYYENKQENEIKYGILYNWYAVNDERGLAPEGWKVPSENDWEKLDKYLFKGKNIGGIKLKSTTGWEGGLNGDNETGFNGLAVGYREKDGKFYLQNIMGFFWSTSSINEVDAKVYYLAADKPNIEKGPNFKANGYSIRCIKN